MTNGALARHGLGIAASVTIHGARDMTKRGRAQIAAWLREQAASLELEGANYAKTFRARYYYSLNRPTPKKRRK